MRVALVTGTRPQIIKSASLLRIMTERKVDFRFIHTGQHYDYEMAAQFISEFAVGEPSENLGVGSGSGSYQIHETMMRLEPVLEEFAPNYLIVPGDTNSALAAALTGFKMDIPTCHLESGLRSFDMLMQEEVNRRLIDHGSAALFAPTDAAVENLRKENVMGSIYQVGDTMYDVLKAKLPQIHRESLTQGLRRKYGLFDENFGVLTLHRRENVDFRNRLESIVDALNHMKFRIVFPLHPRTKECLEKESLTLNDNIIVVPPVSYEQMIALVDQSSLLITDSGGLQKEAYLLNTPCVTIRDNTEWVETVKAGANVLSSTQSEDILHKVSQMWEKNLNTNPSVYGDGKATERILNILQSNEIVIKRSNQVSMS
jgi:UDP-N-acetylglucosamine 2-epimerase